MDNSRIDSILMAYGDKFPPLMYEQLRQEFAQMDDVEANMLLSQLKDPTVMLVFSIFLGGYGVDRILLGDVGLGILKLLTCGGLGIWWLVDLFLVMDHTRLKNAEKILYRRMH